MKQDITIIGAGLVGSMMAIYLGKRGYKVDVFEKLPDIRKEKISAGRSINLALANRGIRPMQQLGIMDKVEKLLIPMKGRMIHDIDGKLQFQSYGQKPEEVIYSVSRGGLVSLLRDEAEATGNVTFYFKQALKSVDYTNNTIELQNQDESTFKHSFKILLGADGAPSNVRKSFEKNGVQGVTFDLLDHSYKELTIPAKASMGSEHLISQPKPMIKEQKKCSDPIDFDPVDFAIDKNSLHIWPRGEYMLIALPNLDGSFTVTLFMPSKGKLSFETLTTNKAVIALFENKFKDARDLMPNLTEMFFENPTGILGTIRCEQWQYKNALLIGDSAHAVVPFHGQGMNCGFEDCYELNALLDKHNDNWEIVMGLYTNIRKPNANAIADMALENYIEMRDSVRDPKFHLKKAIAFELEKRFPKQFIPRYSMVMFHHIGYAEAQARGLIQAGILNQLSAGIEDVEDIGELDIELAGELVKQLVVNKLK
ncbi:MAG: FAD-dependent monooxygenase [Proteobacteria bacterium]|nr:FAD-dependent monooxygenase [Pseudomonadota bacterium]